jgi:tRNA 5-methylaminomethyl-2-thiouridine biosynthesis bifunctional protein
MLAELDARADALFLDGFAPAKNPAMWSAALFGEIARLAAPGTTAATWSVAAPVRAGLELAGFAVGKRRGFGRKREMLAAVRPGASAGAGVWERQSRHAAVIGAGLAGAWVAHALAARGWDVELVERAPAPAREASANPVGVLRPAFNLADNANARLARTAFLRTTRLMHADPAFDGMHARTGLLHVAATPEQARRMATILRRHAFPEALVRGVDADEAARLARRPVAGPGWWIPEGGWARPQGLTLALLARHAQRIHPRFGAAVHSIAHASAGWQALDAAGRTLAQAPVLVLANGYEARRFGLPRMPELVPVRGQVSFLPAAARRSLDIVVGGDGYVAPLPGGGHCIGATFEPGMAAHDVRCADHASNLARAERMLPGFTAQIEAAQLRGWAGTRTATADRLPACGALPLGPQAQDDARAYLVTGLGARGLVWAPLCADVLAAALDDEPSPIERSLVAAMDPLRAARRQP